VSRDRQSSSLGWPPDDPSLLEGFPGYTLSTATRLFRIVQEEVGPWWFGSSMTGRFDLPEPAGTCYVALDEMAALLELVAFDREGGIVSSEFLARRRIRDLRIPQQIEAADLRSRRASGFGVTMEVSVVVPYDCPQAWAARLHEAGYQALVYWLRHDPSRAEGIALFGRHGERRQWRRGRERPISLELIARLKDQCGIQVAPIPTSNELRIVDEEPE
jgi:hypothetical protein